MVGGSGGSMGAYVQEGTAGAASLARAQRNQMLDETCWCFYCCMLGCGVPADKQDTSILMLCVKAIIIMVKFLVFGGGPPGATAIYSKCFGMKCMYGGVKCCGQPCGVSSGKCCCNYQLCELDPRLCMGSDGFFGSTNKCCCCLETCQIPPLRNSPCCLCCKKSEPGQFGYPEDFTATGAAKKKAFGQGIADKAANAGENALGEDEDAKGIQPGLE